MQAVVRKRNTQRSLTMLKSTTKLQEAYRKRAKQKQLDLAVVKIQSSWRRRRVRKHLTELRRNALIKKLETKAAKDRRSSQVHMLKRGKTSADIRRLSTTRRPSVVDLFEHQAEELSKCVVES